MSHKASPAPRSGRLRPNPDFFSPRGTAKEPAVSESILKQARKNGQLNLSNRGLTSVPDSVWRLNIDPPEGAKSDFDSDDRWWEQVDLKRLNLSANEISELSEGLENLSALQILDLQYNKLSSLPRALGSLTTLSELSLSHNALTSIPCDIKNLSSLLVLRLDNNHLSELPDTITHLVSLETLSVSSNTLTCLPAGIDHLLKLKSLNVSQNCLTILPASLGEMRGLRELVLNNNKLTTIPTINGLNYLGELNLRQNQLKELPNLINTPIKSLLLGNNRVNGLSENRLLNLKSLTILELRENKISSLPDCIVELDQLERLDLTNNNLSSLPFIMGRMQTLQSFHLEGNSLKTLRREVISRGTAELLRYLLSRIETDVPETPPTISSPSHSTKMKSAPWSSPSGKENKELNWSKSELTTLPDENLNDLTHCTTLNVSFNKLKILPDTVGILTRLTVLDLSNNQLTDLPHSLTSCTVLQDVFIVNNRLTALPMVLYSVPSLQNILAGDNKIECINVEGLMNLTNLTCLDLHNNSIQQVPPLLGRMEWLRRLEISGNQFRQPRANIVAKGTVELLQYLRDRIPT